MPLTDWHWPTPFLFCAQARELGRELQAWLGQIERELMPQDPTAALALAGAFVEGDEAFFNRADDSGGAVDDALCA
jgi:hypothetical protein